MANQSDRSGVTVTSEPQVSSDVPEQAASTASPDDPETRAQERRSEPRYPTNEPAEILLKADATVPSEAVYGTVVDVSRSGLCLMLPKRIARGEQIQVKLQQNIILGEVRYCRALPGGYQVGLRIEELTRPHPVDEHLSDDSVTLYAAGKGLSVAEVLEVRQHLSRCRPCRVRLAEKQALLRPRHKQPRLDSGA